MESKCLENLNLIRKNYKKLDLSIYENFVMENDLFIEDFFINKYFSTLLINNVEGKLSTDNLVEKTAYFFDMQDYEVLTIGSTHFLIVFEF